MTGKSAIEWTEATWNPIVGCSIVSPGCSNCYAMKMAARIEAMGGQSHYAGTTKRVNGNAVWTGKVALAAKALMAPLKRNKSTTYFVNSMGDLFHEDVPDAWIDSVFAVMAACPEHTFQVLTKRAARMRDYFLRPPAKRDGIVEIARADIIADLVGDFWGGADCHPLEWPLPNVWLGVSTERQQEADQRIPLLLQTPAAIRFISAEPLLGPIDLLRLVVSPNERRDCLKGELRGVIDGHTAWLKRTPPGIDWVIAGGESGHGARPMSIQWVRELRDQCAGAAVPFFFKQWGEWHPAAAHAAGDPGRFAFGDYEHDRETMLQVDGYPRQFTKFGARSTLVRVGKTRAGRLLDGVTHDAFPVRAPA